MRKASAAALPVNDTTMAMASAPRLNSGVGGDGRNARYHGTKVLSKKDCVGIASGVNSPTVHASAIDMTALAGRFLTRLRVKKRENERDRYRVHLVEQRGNE